MKTERLPIGTVVLLEGGTRKVMICGYSSKSGDDPKVYDYNGCIFPEGLMENVFCLFDKKQIEEVCYMGLVDESFEDYNNSLNTSNSFANVVSKGLTFENGESGKSSDTKYRRVPKAPTNPMSKSEMLSKYGVEKQSKID